MKTAYLLCLSVLICLSACNSKGDPKVEPSKPAIQNTAKDFNVLLFSKTAGYRHESIKNGIIAIKQLGAQHNFRVQPTEQAEIFTADELIHFDLIIFLSTTGDILNAEQQAAMEAFIQDGNGFVGIHAATDTEYEWPWYNKLVGAYFADHPPGIHQADIKKLRTHQSVSHLPEVWTRTDEWYNFKSINPNITTILNLEESTYNGGTMGDDHPIAWYQAFDGGRSWYTAGGHTAESFSDADFLLHILGGIKYAAGAFEE